MFCLFDIPPLNEKHASSHGREKRYHGSCDDLSLVMDTCNNRTVQCFELMKEAKTESSVASLFMTIVFLSIKIQKQGNVRNC